MRNYLLKFRLLIVLPVIWLAGAGLVPAANAATDSLEPIYETLQYRQKKQYMDAAPSGNDAPLTAVRPITVNAILPALAEEPTALDQLAQEQTRELTLTEQRQEQALAAPLSRFGYDIFRREQTQLLPMDNLPVPGSYRMGPGDTLVVQLYGKRNVEYRLVVTREGKLLIPEFGPVEVGGLSFDEAKALILSGFEARVIGAKAVVSMGNIRTLQVRLTGDVVAPGTYTISGMSTLVDALLASGGISPLGTLRNIQLFRDNRLVTRFDLYDLLLKGQTEDDVVLMHNDVIFVPAIGDIVSVGGEVRRPAIYELAGERTLGEVLTMAGGLLPTASVSQSHIERIKDDSYRTLVSLDGAAESLVVYPGDFIRVMPLDDRLDQVVMLSGHVKRPGAYELRRSMRVSDVVSEAETLLRNADLDIALLKREERGTKRTIVRYIDLASVLRFPGSDADLALQARDEIVVFNLEGDRSGNLDATLRELDIQSTPYRPANIVTLSGHVRYAGRFPLQDSTRLLDVLDLAGGVQPGTDLGYGVIMRTEPSSGEISPLAFSPGLALGMPNADTNPTVRAGDRIYLFSTGDARSGQMGDDLARLRGQAGFSEQANVVGANGYVRYAGDYPLTPGMRLSDLLCAAGGLQKNAYGVTAELSRFTRGQQGEPRITHIPVSTLAVVDACEAANGAATATGTAALKQRREAAPMPKRVNDVIKPVRFESGIAQLTPTDVAVLARTLGDYAERGNAVQVIVSGHTDTTRLSPTAAARYKDNLGLSLARAEEVALLIKETIGMKMDAIKTEGHGDTRPVATNETAAGRAQNRRVEVHIEVTKPAARRNGHNATHNAAASRYTNMASLTDDPRLMPGDQLTFTEKPGWREVARINLSGEIHRPGAYVIDRDETLCSVMARAGGLTSNAYAFAAEFSRNSTRRIQQETLDNIRGQLDDLMVELSLSHSVNNMDKTPANTDKDEFFRIFKQLEKVEVSGRQVIDLERAMTCDTRFDIVLEDGDALHVPLTPRFVTVVGQVYVPTSHAFERGRDIRDYIELSGGPTVIGRIKDAYAVQANGEVVGMKGRGLRRALGTHPSPGATIYVPLNVDRMNTTEKLQTWTRSLLEVALFAGIIL